MNTAKTIMPTCSMNGTDVTPADGFSYVDSAAAFRTPIGLQLVFAIIVTFIVFGLPESPRWLAKRGREQEAVEVLCAVFDLKEDDPYVVGEMEAIRAAIAVEKGEGASTISGLFKKDLLKTRRRVFLAWFGLFMNQWSGVSEPFSSSVITNGADRAFRRQINLVVYYMPTVLVENVGMTAHRATLIAGGVELMFPLGNTLPALFLDRLGRRRTMMTGCAILAFCMMMITIVGALPLPVHT